jgi:hypothetical protein
MEVTTPQIDRIGISHMYFGAWQSKERALSGYASAAMGRMTGGSIGRYLPGAT